jgi:glycosyltransferase involved in cell wall biosynthesis
VTYDEGSTAFYALHPEVTVHKLKLAGGSVVRRMSNHFRRIPTFRRVIRETQPDIVISFIDRTNVLVLLATLGLDVPVIVSERIDPRRYSPGFPYNFLRRWLYRNATAVIVQSMGQADWFKQMSSRVVVIPNPVNACTNDRNSQAERTSTIIAVGRLTRQKGFDLLLTAFAKVYKKYPEWNLVIYGDGSERVALERQIQEARRNDRLDCPFTHCRVFYTLFPV